MKYAIVRISPKTSFSNGGVTTVEMVDEEPKPEEFNYLEAVVFEAGRWPGCKLGVYSFQTGKVYFKTEKMKEKNILEAVRPFLPKVKEEAIPEVKGYNSIFLKDKGYYTYPNLCSHQFAVFKEKKKTVGIFCARGDGIRLCESNECLHGRYFCAKHIIEMKILGVSFFVCHFCLLGYYLQNLIRWVRLAGPAVYNGIVDPQLKQDDLPQLIRGMKERIFDQTYTAVGGKRKVDRKPLLPYEQQFVQVLLKVDWKEFKKIKQRQIQMIQELEEDDMPISLLKSGL